MSLPYGVGALDGNLFFGGNTDAGQVGLRLFAIDAAGQFQCGFIDVRAGTVTDGLRIRVDTDRGAIEQMRITAGGFVGIGTPAPSERLDVNGNIRVEGNAVVTGNLNVDGANFSDLLSRVAALEQKVGSGSGTTTARTIAVSKQGVGQSTVLTITGGGFTPGSRVVIRVTTADLQQVQFGETAGGDGKFVSSHGVRCVSGGELTVTAFEDANPEGSLANVVVTTCP
jgi:hypothetical protein